MPLRTALRELKLKRPQGPNQTLAAWKAETKLMVHVQRDADIRRLFYSEEGMSSSVFLGLQYGDHFLFKLFKEALEADSNNFIGRLASAFAEVRPTINYQTGRR